MLYPDTLQNYHREASGFTIRDEFTDQVDVRVKAWQLPVINREFMGSTRNQIVNLETTFQRTRDVLNGRLNEILGLKL